MKFRNLKKLSDEQFRRIAGIKRKTFELMISHLKEAEIKKKAKGGAPNKLSIENRLLMALEYLREYRTYAHIAASYGVAESSAYKNIRWIENVLIKCDEFKLPGRKALLKSDHEFEIILVDATETPIERPKKNNVDIIPVKRNDTR